MREMTHSELAKHEAAHFVMHWATGHPAPHVDITPAIQREHQYTITMGLTFGCCTCPSPFEQILISLAGPIGEHWAHDNQWIITNEKVAISNFVQSSINDGNTPRTEDDGDWEGCLHMLARYGVDITTQKHLDNALLFFTGATRSILKLCEAQWREATEHLITHGRIGFNGKYPDQGEEAESFFSRWGGDYGEPPDAVQSVISSFRTSADALK